ncbi:GNAT family protein [Planotetraspora phitsanulokensis]|uniref:N-acetyltransferase n=1 Tax=Planotetraspora phitsanulokensis TaxID=575192 RepID=A0A8J3XH42_9ACTN|nr:GNAT family protein [Planotetraspora phitsanulokensis]GII41572.1 N-acetyltransferase [Planotetraspora phitsanulokensis]
MWEQTHRRESSDACHQSSHVVLTEKLRFQSPTEGELGMESASAGDAEAQHWLGWYPTEIATEPWRTHLLATPPRRKGGVAQFNDAWKLHGVDSRTGNHAGVAGVRGTPHGYEIGGWLAPAFRRRRLGSELFGAALTLAHEHLGIAVVVAGTEITNVACRRALEAAGFIPIQGAPFHVLPNGRVIYSCWYLHTTSTPRRCDQ